MTPQDLLIYTFTFAIAVITPGPTVSAIIGFVLKNGLKGAFAFISGLVFGEYFWLAASIFGVEILDKSLPSALFYIKIAGGLFIIFMAYELFQAAGKELTTKEINNDTFLKLFVTGVIVVWTNAKTGIFYFSILPTLIAGKNIGLYGFFIYGLIMGLVTLVIFCAYALLAQKARIFLNSPQKLKTVQQTNAVLLALVGAIILFSSLI